MNETYKQYSKERIKQIIFMENETRKIRNIEYPRAYEALKGLLGQQIYKKNSSVLFEKFKELYKPLEHKSDAFINCTIWLTCNHYSVYLNIKLCFKEPNKEYGCLYWELNPYILDVKDRVVKKVYDYTPELELLSEEETLKQYETTLKAQEEYNNEREKLFYVIRSEFFRS